MRSTITSLIVSQRANKTKYGSNCKEFNTHFQTIFSPIFLETFSRARAHNLDSSDTFVLQMNQNQRVTLNVGGVCYQVFVKNLVKHPNVSSSSRVQISAPTF
jgi:hypothetical protein